MATSQDAEGTVFSTFALRAPLPAVRSFVDGSDRNEICWTEELKEPTQCTDGRISPSTSSSPPIAFLFRMYVACHILRFANETRFTALVLLHRYSQAKQNPPLAPTTPVDHEDWPWIGSVCLFLASKVEDEPRRLRDIINMAQMVLSSPSSTTKGRKEKVDEAEQIANTAKDDYSIAIDTAHPPPLDGSYWASKKKAIEIEQMVLRWLGFDCSVSHPHRAVFWILEKMISEQGRHCNQKQRTEGSLEPINEISSFSRKLRDNESPALCKDRNLKSSKHNDSIRDKIMPLANRRLNDALFYARALRCGVVELACAAIDLAVFDELKGDGNEGVLDFAATAVTEDAKIEEIQNLTTMTTEINHDSIGSIFKKEWWKKYDVSNKDFDHCRNCLEKATSSLRTMAGTANTSHM